MAAPVYSHDLTTIDYAESTTGWATVNFTGGGGAALDFGPDLAMQGTNCVLRQVSGHERGGVFDNGSTIGGTVAAGVHIYQWVFTANPGLTDTLANRGVCVIAGSSTANTVRFHVDGNNTFGAEGRVGKCYAYRYNNTTSASPPYRTLNGSPGATPQVFGASNNISSSTKGLNLGIDAVRYGTGGYITAGDSGDPATFAGFNATNDSSSNRLGILTAVGSGYELQGKFVIGQNSGGTATLAYFDDSDRAISIVNSLHAESDFTEILIDHASTEVYWSNINITAVSGSTVRGRIEVLNTSSVFEVLGGTLTNFGETFGGNATSFNGTTWRGCEAINITGSTATVVDCIVDSSTSSSSIILDDLSYVSGTTFTSDGSNHALELRNIGFGETMTCANFFNNYAGSDGSTGNEAIYINDSSGSVTINVPLGYDTPSVRTAGATFTIVLAPVDVTITVIDVETGDPIQDARVLLYSRNDNNFFSRQQLISLSGSSSDGYVHAAHSGTTTPLIGGTDLTFIEGAADEEPQYNGSFQINALDSSTSYNYKKRDNEGVTADTVITAVTFHTFLWFNGLTDVNGQVSRSRYITVDEDVVGWVRSATTGTLYRQSTIAATIDSETGLNLTIQMIPDE